MSLAIAGMGWVTPLGSGVDSVWERLLYGDEASATTISEEFNDRSYNVFRVPESVLKGAAHPRLRRASAISRFAAAAGLDALNAAGLKLDSQNVERTALIFAISNGGVIYTKRFYRDIVNEGAQSASPLLFPETVFNAPASHLAAILGISGATYTLVGDGAVGLLAIKMAEDLMANEALDHCLVVGTEEIDWLLCDAYQRWRLLCRAPPIEPFGKHKRGMILSEGAGAILLARLPRRSAAEAGEGSFTIECASAQGGDSKCACLHWQTGLGRERRCCRTVAGNPGDPGPAFCGASACASRRLSCFLAASAFPHAHSKSSPRNRFELRTQSAGSGIAPGNSVIIGPSCTC
ncbi:MAG: hypothetical protein DME52_05385 [Verrucomicrobia bacterium]|nr:MAG: hypothetical protein DME52_05385 [Verrucomicrobiota bacterium]